MAMRIAFASMDGLQIDQHFGSAKRFQIYDLDENEPQFIETRKSQALCQGHCEGGFDHLLKSLHDCDAVFVLKIGESAAAFMISHGKRVFEARGGVLDIARYIIAQEQEASDVKQL